MNALEEAHKRFEERAQAIKDTKESAKVLSDYDKDMQELLDALKDCFRPQNT